MDVAEVLPAYADLFPFDSFNQMQRETLPAVLGTDQNIVVAAPTASGKTAIAEAAIIKTLDAGGTALFIAPMRALTAEREADWDRFEERGYSVAVVTGDRDLNPRKAQQADILVMTPEKVDSATRNHDSRRYKFITDIDLCVVDEVHLLDSPRRGPTLEVTVSRLRTLTAPRIVALSATMPNIDEVAEWLDVPPEGRFTFDDSYRPVKLTAGVKTYTHGENAFADKFRRLYRALDLVVPHLEDDGQGLVFVSSRRETVAAAKRARDELATRDVTIGARGDYELHSAAQSLDNDTLRQSIFDGVGFHHAGLSKHDRNHVEEWFREGQIDLLFSTSTLAWGVNLPARCVVLRDTKYHDPLEGEVDISPLDVIQMLGRAGRPGYDDTGYGWVIADTEEAPRYRRLLTDGKEIESHLTESLGEHLVAEVTLGILDDLEDLGSWVDTTFCAVRARHRTASTDPEALTEQIRGTLTELIEQGFLTTDGALGIEPTPLGRLTTQYYLRLATATRFRDTLMEAPTEAAMLRAVAQATEFDDVRARSDEREAVDAILGEDTDGLSPGRRKVLAIIHATMAGSVPAALRSDAWVIKQNTLRLLSALRAFCGEFATPTAANRARRLEARVAHGVGDDLVALTAIDGVGQTRAQTLADAGLTTPAAIATADQDDLEAAGIGPGISTQLVEAAAELPQLGVDWGTFPETIERGANAFHEIEITNSGDGATVGVVVTVNGVEMTTQTTYLTDRSSVPVGVYGGDAETLEFNVTVVTPRLPLAPIQEVRTVEKGVGNGLCLCGPGNVACRPIGEGDQHPVPDRLVPAQFTAGRVGLPDHSHAIRLRHVEPSVATAVSVAQLGSEDRRDAITIGDLLSDHIQSLRASEKSIRLRVTSPQHQRRRRHEAGRRYRAQRPRVGVHTGHRQPRS